MARSRTDRLESALAAIEAAWGPIPGAPEWRPVDYLVALLLSMGGEGEKAAKGVALLQEEFVDWNEVRISWVREVSGPLAGAGFSQPADRAQKVVSFLEGLYRRKNAVNLTFLEAMAPEEVLAFLQSLPGAAPGIAAGLASLYLPPGEVLPSADLIRVGTRIGIAGKGATPAKVRKALEAAAEGHDRLRMHALLTRLADDPCRSRSPHCAECPALSVCDYGRSSAPAAKPAAAAEKPEREVQPAAGKKAPAKKPSAKPAAKKTKTATKKTKTATKPAAAKKAPGRKAPGRKPAPKRASSRRR